jgi:hypothetical protein
VYESMYTMIILESISKQCREMIKAEAYKHLFTSATVSTSLIAVSSSAASSSTSPNKTTASPVTPIRIQKRTLRTKSENDAEVRKGKESASEIDESNKKTATTTTPTSQAKKKSFKNGFNHLYNAEKYLSYDDLKDCILIVDTFINDMLAC